MLTQLKNIIEPNQPIEQYLRYVVSGDGFPVPIPAGNYFVSYDFMGHLMMFEEGYEPPPPVVSEVLNATVYFILTNGSRVGPVGGVSMNPGESVTYLTEYPVKTLILRVESTGDELIIECREVVMNA